MKAPLLFVFAACLGLLGCTSTPPPPRPFMGILDAHKVGDAPRDRAPHAVAVRYEDVVPGKHEIKIGFGYEPPAEDVKAFQGASAGIYAIAHTEVLQQATGEIRVTIDPVVVRNLGGKLGGKIHAILSEYPHGKEWPIVKHDVFVLQPE